MGKTFYAAALIRKLRAEGQTVLALKPVISGFDPGNIAASDTGMLLAAQGLEISGEHCDLISPWRFAAPISPDMAAEDSHTHMEFSALVDFCTRHTGYDYHIIEGAGGVMTPVNRDHTMLDLMETLQHEVILLCGTYLGSISHTLTACHALASRHCVLHSLIVNESGHPPVPLARTLLTLKQFLPNVRIEAIPRHFHEAK